MEVQNSTITALSDQSLTAGHLFTTIQRRDPFLDLASPEALQMIQTWLNECISQHERCETRADHARPTYLIDVGGEESQEIHLIQTKSDLKYRFIALSYVWGVPRQPIELRTHTVEDMLVSISGKDVPQTILDAMEMTRRTRNSIPLGGLTLYSTRRSTDESWRDR